MATFATNLDAALLMASNQKTVRDDLDTAFTTLQASLSTVIVTNAGKTSTDPEFVAVEDGILSLARLCASATDDYAS